MKPRNIKDIHNLIISNQKLNMKLGFDFKEVKDEIFLDFKQEIPNWKRFASELINDKVILDLKNGKKLIETYGDFIVYEVYNLWKSIKNFKEIYEKVKIATDITLLNHGIFSLNDKGELFSTYGHAHEKEIGEAYLVLSNECFLILSNRENYETYIIQLKKGDFIYIHPKFIHRITSYKKDCLLMSFVPEEAGHNYLLIKGKGFPFHIFYDKKKRKIEIKKNKNYKTGKYKIVKKIERKLNPLKLLIKNPEKLKDILENPEKYKKIYF